MLSIALLAFIVVGLRAPFWVALLVAPVVPLTLAVVSARIGRRFPEFDRTFNRALQQGDVDGMLRAYHKARLLRLLGPQWRMLPKLGLIRLMRGDARGAQDLLEDAYEQAPPSERAQLLGPLARVKYELGEMNDLREIAEQWRARAVFPGSANVYLAAACIRDWEPDAPRALELLDEAEGMLGTTEKELAADVRARAKAILARPVRRDEDEEEDG